MLAFFLLPVVGYAKLNEPTIASAKSCHLIKNVLLCEFNQFNIPLKQNVVNISTATKLVIKVVGQEKTLIQGQWEDWGVEDIYVINPNGIDIRDFKTVFPIKTNLYFSTAHNFDIENQKFIFDKLPKPITIKNSKLEFESHQSLSVFAGEISFLDSTLILPDGDIHVLAARGAGYVKIHKNTVNSYFFDKLANINIKRKLEQSHYISFKGKFAYIADINVSGEAGGLVFLRGHNLMLDNAWIFSDTSSKQGKGINIKIDNDITISNAGRITCDVLESSVDGIGGNIQIQAENNIVLDGYSYENYQYEQKIKNKNEDNFDQMFSSIATNIFGGGRGGNIIIQAKQLIIQNRAAIQASLAKGSTGDAGTVDINTLKGIKLKNYAQLSMFATEGSEGNIGKLTIQTNDVLTLQDSIIRLQNNGSGKGGELFINVKELELFNTDKNLAWIATYCLDLNWNHTTVDNTNIMKPQASILGFVKNQAKKASDINVNAINITLSEGSYIDNSSLNHVKSGDININTNNITLKGETCPSYIKSAALDKGDGGHIKLKVKNKFLLKQGSAIIANSYQKINGNEIQKNPDFCHIDKQKNHNKIKMQGKSGNIEIDAKYLFLDTNSRITVRSNDHKKVGKIYLKIDKMDLQNKSCIIAYSQQTNGGDIEIIANKGIYLENSQITASISSFKDYLGGNITIGKPKYIILNNSDILAQAYKDGRGGNINIAADIILESSESLINASSKKGIDGKEYIDEKKPQFKQQWLSKLNIIDPPQPTKFRACEKQDTNTLLILEDEPLNSHPFTANSFVEIFEALEMDKNNDEKQLVKLSTPQFSTANSLYKQRGVFVINEIKLLTELEKDFFINRALYKDVDCSLSKNYKTDDLYKKIYCIIKRIELPRRFEFYDLLHIQDQIQTIFNDYYNEVIDGYEQGQIYSAHNTVAIPNQSIDDGVVNIQIAAERLADIRFINGQISFDTGFIKSHLNTERIFRTQKLHYNLQKMLQKGTIKQFTARLQTGKQAFEKILYIYLKPEIFNLIQKSNKIEYHNQLGRNDHGYQVISKNVRQWYQNLPINHLNTTLEGFTATEKREQTGGLAVDIHNYLQKIILKHPVYQKYNSEITQGRTKEELWLNVQLKNQFLETNIGQKAFNLISDMLQGKKSTLSYYFGQQWLKMDENGYFEQISTDFETGIDSEKNIFNYQHYKMWNTHVNWKINIQFANQHSDILDYFYFINTHYPNVQFANRNGFSSYFNLKLPIKYFVVRLFFDVGLIWGDDSALFDLLLAERKRQLYESAMAYYKNNSSEMYADILKQPLWNQKVKQLIQSILQQKLAECHEIFTKLDFRQLIENEKLNQLDMYRKKDIVKQCDLQFLLSAGMRIH